MLTYKKSMRKVLAMLVLVAVLPAGAWAFGGPGGSGGDRPKDPPQEAIEACEGKSTGDSVEFTGRRGETVEGTCQDVNGQLVAVPEGRRGPRRQ